MVPSRAFSSLPAPGCLLRNMVTIYVTLSRCDPASSHPGPLWGKGEYSSLSPVESSVARGQPVLDSPSLVGSSGWDFGGYHQHSKHLPIMLLGGRPRTASLLGHPWGVTGQRERAGPTGTIQLSKSLKLQLSGVSGRLRPWCSC